MLVRVDTLGGINAVGIGTTNPTSKFEVNGSIKPGTATTGSACSTEGAFAYDESAHAPIYCNQSGGWVAIGGGTVPSGTHCGLRIANCNGGGYLSYDVDSFGRSAPGLSCQGNVLSVATCGSINESFMPDLPSGCPSGYTVRLIPSFGGTAYIFCVKN